MIAIFKDVIKFICVIIVKLYYTLVKKVRFKKKTKINIKCRFEGANILYDNVTFINSKLGYGTYIGSNSNIYNTEIKRFCSIGPKLSIVIGKHPVNKFVSTHPAFFSLRKQAGFTFVDRQLYDENKYADDNNKISVIIGNDVWIGANTTILEGVKIGDGAIIGANTLVNKDIEPYSINVGIPAKKIGYRFDKDKIDFLLKFKWWEKDLEWIRNNAEYFSDVNSFYNNFNK